MSTQLLERPDLKKSDKDDTPYHYVRKDLILPSVIEGTAVKALCGAVFVVAKAPKSNYKVCPPCKELYQALP